MEYQRCNDLHDARGYWIDEVDASLTLTPFIPFVPLFKASGPQPPMGFPLWFSKLSPNSVRTNPND